MIAPARSASAFTPVRGLATVGALAGLGAALAAWSAATPWGVPCPWRLLTGTLCPFCGTTTMFKRLFVGDVAGAWSANQLVFAAGCLVALACGTWVVQLAGGPAVRLPGWLRDERARYLAGAIACAAFVVWRNVGR